MRGRNKTPLTFSCSAEFQQFVRTLSLLDTFDAVMLAAILSVPYGTVTRLLAPLKAAGYVVEVGAVEYAHDDLDTNPAFLDWRFNCQDAEIARTKLLRKSPTFMQYLARYTAFWFANEAQMARPLSTGKIRGDVVGALPATNSPTPNSKDGPK